MKQEEQEFLQELEKKLWTAANKLLPSLDASQYKHVVLGLVFLKYVSDAFDLRRAALTACLKDDSHDYYLDPADFDSPEDYEAEINAELEQRDYYAEANVFWVPAAARWRFLQDKNKVVISGEKNRADARQCACGRILYRCGDRRCQRMNRPFTCIARPATSNRM